MKAIINGLAIEYLDEGNGKTMVFLHGWGDNLHTFDALAAILGARGRIVRVDVPGFGASESPKIAWDLDHYVEFVRDFCVKIHINPDVIIGHSFGGRIAIKAAAKKIINPQKIVLIASAGIAERQTLRNFLFMILAKTGRIITVIPPFSFWRKQLREKMYSHSGSDYPAAGNLRETFLKIVRQNLSSYARMIEIPALLIWGDTDTETPLADGRRLARLIRNSRLEIISGAGHFVHRDSPNRVAELIQEFLLP